MSVRYMICSIGGIPHIVDDLEAENQLIELNINMIECKYELPDMPSVTYDYDIFGDQVLVSSVGAILAENESN